MPIRNKWLNSVTTQTDLWHCLWYPILAIAFDRSLNNVFFRHSGCLTTHYLKNKPTNTTAPLDILVTACSIVSQYFVSMSCCDYKNWCHVVLSSVQYCHYVAGLVGIGLSQLFSASQLEDPEVGRDTELANSMGLFLQKTNIIRDYLEDTQEGRAFWPQEVRSWYERVCFTCVSDLRPTVTHYDS